jgi:hypothetical protein
MYIAALLRGLFLQDPLNQWCLLGSTIRFLDLYAVAPLNSVSRPLS